MYHVCQIRCQAKSGHYFVFVGDAGHAHWKWSEVYPAIPFASVNVTREVLYTVE